MRYFLFLLLLSSFDVFGQGIYAGKGVLVNGSTTGTNLVLVVGESNAGDTNASTAYGPTTPAGVALKWNGSGVTDVASTDFNNTAGTHGTMWKQFCLTAYN